MPANRNSIKPGDDGKGEPSDGADADCRPRVVAPAVSIVLQFGET